MSPIQPNHNFLPPFPLQLIGMLGLIQVLRGIMGRHETSSLGISKPCLEALTSLRQELHPAHISAIARLLWIFVVDKEVVDARSPGSEFLRLLFVDIGLAGAAAKPGCADDVVQGESETNAGECFWKVLASGPALDVYVDIGAGEGVGGNGIDGPFEDWRRNSRCHGYAGVAGAALPLDRAHVRLGLVQALVFPVPAIRWGIVIRQRAIEIHCWGSVDEFRVLGP